MIRTSCECRANYCFCNLHKDHTLWNCKCSQYCNSVQQYFIPLIGRNRSYWSRRLRVYLYTNQKSYIRRRDTEEHYLETFRIDPQQGTIPRFQTWNRSMLIWFGNVPVFQLRIVPGCSEFHTLNSLFLSLRSQYYKLANQITHNTNATKQQKSKKSTTLYSQFRASARWVDNGDLPLRKSARRSCSIYTS